MHTVDHAATLRPPDPPSRDHRTTGDPGLAPPDKLHRAFADSPALAGHRAATARTAEQISRLVVDSPAFASYRTAIDRLSEQAFADVPGVGPIVTSHPQADDDRRQIEYVSWIVPVVLLCWLVQLYVAEKNRLGISLLNQDRAQLLLDGIALLGLTWSAKKATAALLRRLIPPD